ncbi:MAG: carbon-nitrogen hydrolase family protein [Blautia sp.]|nr:carbon-nitrogen hydrolase family protein [Blautia sp.]MCM1201962.1 carbon-nitrogen hydrolase family protein [Bacteroides fragilis]
MEKLKIALLQLASTGTMQGNWQKGIEFCKKAKRQGADIALFPEMWNNGYTIPADTAGLKALAVPADGAFVCSFAELARELDMAIGITFLEAHEPLPRNTVCLFDRKGILQYTYAKVHTCDFGDECRLDAGEDFYVARLDTAKGVIKVGSMICYDREFPESARILMLKGAELLLVPNACPMEINRLSQLRGRAYENMLAIATCNYPKDQPDCNGHSTVFDGVAYLPELPGSRDTCILEAGEEEGIYLAGLDIDMLRAYREKEVHGNAYRHPEKYGILTEKRIEVPFIREDYREQGEETY